MFDCRSVHDPTTTRHVGYNPKILEATADSPAFLRIADVIGAYIKESDKDDMPVAYVCFCRSGHHRSVAVATGLQPYLSYARIEWDCVHLSGHEWAKRTCAGKCAECHI